MSLSLRARWWTTRVRSTCARHRTRGLDEHELVYFVFEHGVSQGLRLAELHREHERARERQDENVFDIPAIARRNGWDKHELDAHGVRIWGGGRHENDGGVVA